MAGVHQVARQGFGANVQAYESARPSFPADAICYILSQLRPDSQILDVGAGTGKFTRLLASKCGPAHVQAIEPVKEMRECFQRTVPDVRIKDGQADTLPLPDSSMDCITCAQVSLSMSSSLSCVQPVAILPVCCLCDTSRMLKPFMDSHHHVQMKPQRIAKLPVQCHVSVTVLHVSTRQSSCSQTYFIGTALMLVDDSCEVR